MKKLLKILMIVLMLASCLTYADRVMAEGEEETGEASRRRKETFAETGEPEAFVEETAETKADGISVSLTCDEQTVYAGENVYFTASVSGDEANAGVTWELFGAENGRTGISSQGVNCTLYVYGLESAEKLTVRATSKTDTSKYAELVITVNPSAIIKSVDFNFDFSSLDISEAKTGKEVSKAIRNLLDEKSLNEELYFDDDYCFLARRVEDGETFYFERLSSSIEYLNPNHSYYVVFDIGIGKEGYVWDDSKLPMVTVNSEDPDCVLWYDSESWATGWIDVYVQVLLDSQLAKPKLVNIYNSANGADIRFDLVENVEAYYLMQKYNGTWSPVKRFSFEDYAKAGDHYKIFDTSIKNSYGKGYIYSIAVKDNNGNYIYNTKGLPLYRLKQPTIKSVKSSAKGQATLTWTKEACHGYEVQYSLDGKNWTKAPQIKSGSTTTQTITGLTSGKKYYFRIRCQKTNADRGTTWSQYSTNSSVKVK